MPLSLVCGAECQIVSVGSGAAAESHWSGTYGDGSVSIESTVVRSGDKSLKFSSGTGTTKRTTTHHVGHLA